jgi:hypothetical protein
MGRELKRVALDFDWPLNKAWSGFINDKHDAAVSCPQCGGDGCSPEARHLKNLWYGYDEFRPEDRGSVPLTPDDAPVRAFAERNVAHAPAYCGKGEGAIIREAKRLCAMWNTQWSHHLNQADVDALVAANRLWDFTRTFTPGIGWQDKDPPYAPTAKEINAWSIGGLAHDSINQWAVVRAECERLGHAVECANCAGDGETWPSKEAKAAYDAWESTEPPSGEGYQIWETVSEGSPISPVFSTPEELARHMAGRKWGADDGTPYETWLKFITGPGWAPSMVADSKGLRSGVDAVIAMEGSESNQHLRGAV